MNYNGKTKDVFVDGERRRMAYDSVLANITVDPGRFGLSFGADFGRVAAFVFDHYPDFNYTTLRSDIQTCIDLVERYKALKPAGRSRPDPEDDDDFAKAVAAALAYERYQEILLEKADVQNYSDLRGWLVRRAAAAVK